MRKIAINNYAGAYEPYIADYVTSWELETGKTAVRIDVWESDYGYSLKIWGRRNKRWTVPLKNFRFIFRR